MNEEPEDDEGEEPYVYASDERWIEQLVREEIARQFPDLALLLESQK
jgi:hypothetical protein